MNKEFVSIILPVFNDAPKIQGFIEELRDFMAKHYEHYEILLVDDASQDETPKVIDGILRSVDFVRYLRILNHGGEDVVIGAGLDTAIGDFVVIMRVSRDPIELIPLLIEKAERCGGMAVGVSDRSLGGPFQKLLAGIFYWYCRRRGIAITPNAMNFIALPRTSVNALIKNRQVDHYLRLFKQHTGMPVEEYRYHPSNSHSESDGLGYRVIMGLKIIMSYTKHPLRVISYLGIIVALFNLFYWIGRVYFGWSFGSSLSDVAVLSIEGTLGFLLFMTTFIVAYEYAGNFLNETRHNRTYSIESEKKSSIVNGGVRKERPNVETSSAD